MFPRADRPPIPYVRFLSHIVATLAALLVGALPAAAEDPPLFSFQWGGPGAGNGQFANPDGSAIDASGNIYVADHNNHRIQKFDALGNFILTWGSFGAGDGQLNRPIGVDIDSADNVYVVEYDNHRVSKFTSVGGFLLKWGTFGSGDGQLANPRGIAVDGAGNVYVTDDGNDRVQKFTSSGGFLLKWGGFGTGDGQFNFAHGIALDPAGNVYVSDYNNNRVQKFTGAGAFLWKLPIGTGPAGLSIRGVGDVYVSLVDAHVIQMYVPPPPIAEAPPDFLGKWGSNGSAPGQFSFPRRMAVDLQRNVWIADDQNHRVQKFDEDGNLLLVLGSFGTGLGQFDRPVGVATDDTDFVYVADGLNHRIQKFTATGLFVQAWGSNGSGNGQFQLPTGVATRFEGIGGVIYVADFSNHRVQRFDLSGVFEAKWGSFGSANGQFNQPADVFMEEDGEVLVADLGNHRIQKFNQHYVGNRFVTKWGSQGSGNGQFQTPNGVAASDDGSIYVSDTDNHRIQKFGSLPPVITAVDDAPGDQGLQVRVTFDRSGRDFANSSTPVVQYDIFRRIEAAQARLIRTATGEVTLPRPVILLPVHGSQLSTPLLRDAGWDFVGSTPASAQLEYSLFVPTLADSTGSGIAWSTFFARAATGVPTTYFDSEPDSGYSVDNLAPAVPPAPLVTENPGELALVWDPSDAPDFFYFGVYRGDSPGFLPGSPQDFYAVTTDPAYTDTQVSAGETWWYRVAAFDDAENFSGYSESAGATVTTGGPVLAQGSWSLALLPNTPNPFRQATTLRFSLAAAGPVTLRVYDVRGAVVRTVVRETRDAGLHAVAWDGRADDGRFVASGTYLYELQAEGRKLVRKLSVTR